MEGTWAGFVPWKGAKQGPMWRHGLTAAAEPGGPHLPEQREDECRGCHHVNHHHKPVGKWSHSWRGLGVLVPLP